MISAVICTTFIPIFAERSEYSVNRQFDYGPLFENYPLVLNRISEIRSDEDIDAEIAQIMAAYHIPGVSALIFKNDKVIWTGAYGYANFEENTPVADTTSFMLASISKTVTGTALMQLWENGLFDLDDPINDYLPFSVYNPNHPGYEMTFRQLLTHTSSLRDNWSVMYYYEGDSPIPLGVYCEEYFTPGGDYYSASSNFFTWAPGQSWTYCNNAIVLAGYLVEAITGVDFDQYCRDSIFTPLDMTHTSWFLEGMDTSNVAMPYSYTGGSYVPYGHFGYSDFPAGQLRSSSLDLARHTMIYLNHGQIDGIRILDSATVAEMLSIQFPEIRSDQGLIWFHNYDGSRWLWRHGGGDHGVSTMASFCPDEKVGVIVLTNISSPAATGSISSLIFEYAKQNVILTGGDLSDDGGGDGDGVAEAGETAQLVCTFANFFTDTVYNVGVNLIMDDASLNIIHGTANLGDIAPDDSATNAGQPFEFTVPIDYISRINTFLFELTWDDQTIIDTSVMTITIGNTSILLVDDDDNRDRENYYLGCFDRARVPCDNLVAPPAPELADLAAYDVVIWFTGDYRTDPLDSEEIDALKSFMDAGGNLFLSGQGIAAQLNDLDSAFLHTYLKSEYLSSTLIPVLSTAPGGHIFDIADTIAIYGGGGAMNQTAPDQIIPTNGGVGEMYYIGGTDLGAVSYSGNHKLVFFGFGFEAIVNSDVRWTERDVVLTEILDFFEYPMPVTPMILAVSPGDPTHLTDHAPYISWSYGAQVAPPQDMYHIQAGNDNDWTSAEMWDYGPITSPETGVVYDGSELGDGETYYFRVRVNDGANWSNWYYGHIKMNSCPTVPTGLSPDNMQEIESNPPSLSHTNAEDNEGDALTYSYELYDDSLLSSLVAQAAEYPQETGGTTVWEVPSALPDGEDYFWRVRSGDGFELGGWSELASFLIPLFYVCGDANGDGTVNVGDAVFVINYVFKGGLPPEPPEAGDANADGQCNVGDAVYLINYVFNSGPEPQCP